jgi:hypothetical protein
MEVIVGKKKDKEPHLKARKKVARAQATYMKAVARGEREIRSVRAKVDERIARAKAEFEVQASELADLEGGTETPAETEPTPKAASLEVVQPVADDGNANGVTKSAPKKPAPRARK